MYILFSDVHQLGDTKPPGNYKTVRLSKYAQVDKFTILKFTNWRLLVVANVDVATNEFNPIHWIYPAVEC